MTRGVHVAGILREYGTWSEGRYDYGTSVAGEAIAVKRFSWTARVTARHTALDFTLSYFAESLVDPRRMNDLDYLGEQERKALEILVQMVQIAVADGVGYIGMPNPAREVEEDLVQMIREWVTQGGSPEAWEPMVAQTIDRAFARLSLWKEGLQAIQARVDPVHATWGLAFDIIPPKPSEAMA